MNLKLKNFIKKVSKKIPRFYKQKKLIELKKELATRIKIVDEVIKKATSETFGFNEEVFKDYSTEMEKLLLDQKKVKLSISRNNSKLFINKLIYKREEIITLLRIYQNTMRNLPTDKRNFVNPVIIKLQNKLNKIEKKQNKHNNCWLAKSLLTLQTI